MSKFPYVANRNAKHDPLIEKVQRFLNYLRGRYHCNWPSLVVDGLYGNMTADAVKGFQYWKLSRGNGILDIKTYEQIEKSIMISPSKTIADSQGNRSLYDSVDYIAKDIIKPIAEILDTCFGSIDEQLNQLKTKEISSRDLKILARNIFENPNLQSIEKRINREVYDYYKKLAKSNTDIANYRRNKQTNFRLWQISMAQREISNGFSIQTKNMINKRVLNELLDKAIAELDSANFTKKIEQKINSAIPQIGHNVTVKIPVGKVIKGLLFLPLVIHVIELVKRMKTGESTDDMIKTVIADLIALLEEVVLGVIIAFVVSICGLFGGVAVVVGAIIAIILGVIMMIFFPDYHNVVASKIYSYIDSTFSAILYQNGSNSAKAISLVIGH